MNSITSNSSQISLSGTTSGSYITYSFDTLSGSEIKLETKKTPQGISPALYMRFVKSKFTKTQKLKLENRMRKLRKLIPYSKIMGQQALYEELSKELAIILKESEIEVLGLSKYVEYPFIHKFMDSVRDKVIKLEKLENFPRVIPKDIQKKLLKIQRTKVFDSFHVLFIDLSKAESMKTNSDKIANKDPILFGRSKLMPAKYFFIADWVDEYCDLTMESFIEKFKVDDPEFSLSEIPELNKDHFESIVDEVMERHKRLEETNQQNWRDKVREEERDKLKNEKK